MNRHKPQFTVIERVGIAILLSLGSLGALNPAVADDIETGLYEPGLSDGRGVGIDLSIQGELDQSRSPHNVPSSQLTEQPNSPETPTHPSQPQPARPEIRLFGDSDRSFGVEILNRSGRQEQRVRIGIPFL